MLVTKWERTLRRLERLPAATVGIASGDCGGVALDAFLATDVRVATPDTRLLVPRDGMATWPGMASFRLVQQAGAARTRRAVLFGRPIDTAEAQALGIIDEVADDPATAVTAVAQLVGDLSGREVAVRRQLMLDATTTSFEEALGMYLGACDRALRRGSREEVS
jgi:isomerase DpgB